MFQRLDAGRQRHDVGGDHELGNARAARPAKAMLLV